MGDDTKPTYHFGRFWLDSSEQVLLLDRKPVPLPPKVLDTLVILVKRSGHVVSKDEIMSAVWGATFVEESSLTRNISLLRKALREEETEKYIETVPKRGYRFVAPVRIIEVDTPGLEETMNQGDGHQPRVFNPDQIKLVNDETPPVFAIPASTSIRRPQLFLVALIVLITLSITGGLVWQAQNRGNASRPRPIHAASSATDHGSTASVGAYRHYRIGYHFWNKRGKPNLAKAIQHFRLATEGDPNYALAYASLADSYMMEAFFGYENFSQQEAYDKGRLAAVRAFQLDDTLPESHLAVGFVKEFEGDLVQAERSYRRAMEMNPSLALARLRYSHLLASTSRLTEAIAELQIAHQLDPVSSFISGALGNYLLLARKYDESIDFNKLALELDPEDYLARSGLGWAYAGKGMYDNATIEFNVLTQTAGFELVGAAGMAYVDTRKGRLSEARRRLAQIKTENEKAPQATYFLTALQVAKVFCAFGEREEALVWVQRASPIGRLYPFQFEYGAELETLRTDPRYAQLTAEARSSPPPVIVDAQ